MCKCAVACAAVAVLGVGAPMSGAQVVLTASATADNIIRVAISTDDSVQGDLFINNSAWPTLTTANVEITEPGTYFLHVRAQDVGRPEMFIGEFTLNSPDAFFENGTQTLLTGDAAWRVSDTGFGENYVDPTVIGPNGTSPWGNFAVDPEAQFIWHPSFASIVYFSTSFTVVPAPAGLAVVGLGGVLAVRRRRA